MDLLGSSIEKFQETETPKKIPYVSGNRKPKKASDISGNGTFQSTPKKFIILQETEVPKKFLIFSQKKDFRLFWETETSKKSFIFQETELSYIPGSNLQNLKIKKFLYFF